jgi:hypothetical protein
MNDVVCSQGGVFIMRGIIRESVHFFQSFTFYQFAFGILLICVFFFCEHILHRY